MLLLITMLSQSQIIKPLRTFYTDYIPSSADEVFNPKYYKDINNYFTGFTGTWSSQIGTNTFVLTLWKVTKKPVNDSNGNIIYYLDYICGHYKMVQNYGTSNETIIYTSNVNFFNSTTPMNYSIYADSTTLNKLSGIIYDTNTMSVNRLRGKRGFLLIEISDTNPSIANWSVSDSEEINIESDFFIPTNTTLTKQ